MKFLLQLNSVMNLSKKREKGKVECNTLIFGPTNNIIMNKNYSALKGLIFLFVIFTGTFLKAQTDTIPPKIHGCGDTIKVQVGTVYVWKLPRVTDNMTDSAEIMISSKWGSNGAINTNVKGIYTLIITAFDTSGNVVKCERYYKVGDFIPSSHLTKNSLVNLELFPNPANNQISIQMAEILTNAQVFVYSANGQLVYAVNIGQNSVIDTHLFANGVYHIRILSDEQVFQKVVIIQH